MLSCHVSTVAQNRSNQTLAVGPAFRGSSHTLEKGVRWVAFSWVQSTTSPQDPTKSYIAVSWQWIKSVCNLRSVTCSNKPTDDYHPTSAASPQIQERFSHLSDRRLGFIASNVTVLVQSQAGRCFWVFFLNKGLLNPLYSTCPASNITQLKSGTTWWT